MAMRANPRGARLSVAPRITNKKMKVSTTSAPTAAGRSESRGE